MYSEYEKSVDKIRFNRAAVAAVETIAGAGSGN